MAVDKMELLKRYKELKAQGVEITLMELKKQIERENIETPSVSDASGVNVATSSLETPSVSGSSGVNVATSSLETPSVSDASGVNVVASTNDISQESTYNFATPEQSQPQQSSSWTTSYSQPAPVYNSISDAMPTPVSNPTPESYSGNINTLPVQNSIYLDNFNANYSFGAQEVQPQPLAQAETVWQPSVNQPQNTSSQVVLPQEPAKYCLIGYPLGHSLSTYIHNAGFASMGLNSTYDILETPPDSLVDRIKFLKSNNYAGFNVTIPLKLPVTLFLNEIDLSADIVGAVNTVVIKPDKTMKGYNTDVIGFRNAIPKDFVLAGKVAGVLGTGGAARAAITALAQSQVRKIKVYTRNIPNCSDLMKFLREKFPMTEFEVFQIERIRDLSDIDILVNTTPIGMQGRAADFTPVEENELRTLPQGALVYDVIYNPKKTVLLKLAQKNGYRTINGVDMFIHQAVAAEEIWTGRTPDFKDMKIAALENL